MIYEGSCNTEDRSDGSFALNHILKYCKPDYSYYKL